MIYQVSEPFLQLRARGIGVVLKPPLWEAAPSVIIIISSSSSSSSSIIRIISVIIVIIIIVVVVVVIVLIPPPPGAAPLTVAVAVAVTVALTLTVTVLLLFCYSCCDAAVAVLYCTLVYSTVVCWIGSHCIQIVYTPSCCMQICQVDAKGQLSSTGRYLSHFMQRRRRLLRGIVVVLVLVLVLVPLSLFPSFFASLERRVNRTYLQRRGTGQMFGRFWNRGLMVRVRQRVSTLYTL